ncbi:MAG: Holliday junction resolvase RuvX [Clostridia bacterium]|nr:Holliday junction resolvase RuvX [Clostridia bacterium]
MRYMALDMGDVRIGVATSDMTGTLAGALETYYRVSEDKDLEHFARLIKDYDIGAVVIGLPLNMDGSKGERALMAEEWGRKLKDYANVEVVYQDERLTTVSSERVLIESGMRREKRKKVIDRVAAVIILQTYLDSPRKLR